MEIDMAALFGGRTQADDGPALRCALIGGDDALATLIDGGVPETALARRVAAADWRSALNPAEVAAVIADLAPALRPEVVREALGSGLPLLVRGPLARSRSDMAALQRLATMTGVAVVPWHPWLFHPAWTTLRELGEMIGPVRAVRALVHAAEDLPPADLAWTYGGDAVAACLEQFGALPDHCSADWLKGGGILLRLGFGEDAGAEIRIIGRAAAPRLLFALYRDAVTMAFRSESGLSLHPPDPHFAPPAGAGEPVDIPAETLEHGGDAQALRTFAHVVMAGEPQPELLSFAADVVAVMEDCLKDLAPTA